MRKILIGQLLLLLAFAQHAVAKEGVYSASLSHDSRYALIAPINTPAKLYDHKLNKMLYSWLNSKDTSDPIIATELSHDNAYALTAQKHSIALWDTRNGQALAYWRTKERIKSIALSRHGHYALLGFESGQVIYLDLHSGKTVRRFHHQGAVNSVALSNDNRYAMTGSDDAKAILWNIQTGKIKHTWTHKKRVTKVIISPFTHFAMSAESHGNVYIWALNKQAVKAPLFQQASTITAARFSRDEKYLALGLMPQKLLLWDIEKKQTLKTWVLPSQSHWLPSASVIKAIAFDKDNTVYTEDSQGSFKRWPLN